MTILLIIFTVVCPLFFWVGKSDMRGAQEMFFQMGITALAIASFMFFNTKPVKRNNLNICVGAFGIYTLALFLLGGANRGATTLMNIFMGILLYYITLSVKKEDTHLILKSVIWVCIANLLLMALQAVNMDFIFNMRMPGGIADQTDLIGFLGIKSVMGMYMSLGMLAMLLVNPFLAILFAIPIGISVSTGAWLGAVTSVLFYFWWQKRKFVYILAPILIIGSILYIVFIDAPMGMFGSRPPMWKIAMKDVVYGYNLKEPRVQSPFLRNMLTGFGLDAVKNGSILYVKEANSDKTIRAIKVGSNVYTETGDPFMIDKLGQVRSNDGKIKYDLWDNLHCFFVQFFYEMGLLGMIMLGFILFYMKEMFKYAVKSKELVVITSMIIFLFVASLTQFPFYLGRIGYILPILAGLFVVNSEE